MNHDALKTLMVSHTQLSLILIHTGVPQQWMTTNRCSAHPWLTCTHNVCQVTDIKHLDSFNDAVQFCRSLLSPKLSRSTWAVSPMASRWALPLRRADFLLCVNSRHCHKGIITGIWGGFGQDLEGRPAPSASLAANIHQSHQSGEEASRARRDLIGFDGALSDLQQERVEDVPWTLYRRWF